MVKERLLSAITEKGSSCLLIFRSYRIIVNLVKCFPVISCRAVKFLCKMIGEKELILVHLKTLASGTTSLALPLQNFTTFAQT